MKPTEQIKSGKCPLSTQLTVDILSAQIGAIDAINLSLLCRYDDLLRAVSQAKAIGMPTPVLTDVEKAAAYFSIIQSFAVGTAMVGIQSGQLDLIRSLAKACDDWVGQQTNYGGRDMTSTKPNPNLQDPPATAPKPTPQPSVN